MTDGRVTLDGICPPTKSLTLEVESLSKQRQTDIGRMGGGGDEVANTTATAQLLETLDFQDWTYRTLHPCLIESISEANIVDTGDGCLDNKNLYDPCPLVSNCHLFLT